MQTVAAADRLVIAGVELRSRLFVGTGKYPTDESMLAALEASGCELVTVALRRLDLDNPTKKTILDVIDWKRFRILPNTAGCRTADEAVRIARLARSMGLSDWVKLEVIPDPRYLFPDPEETLRAARVLVAEGFKVLPYINADPVLAKKLEEIGTDRFGPGSPDSGADQDHHRRGFDSCRGRRGDRSAFRCSAGDGARRRRRAGEHRDRARARPCVDGRRHQGRH
jgi:thiazole synthase